MEQFKKAADQTRVILTLPPKWLDMYTEFITKNAGAVGQVEGALRSLTYIMPGAPSTHSSRRNPMNGFADSHLTGRFRESEVASETLNSSVLLLSLYHDSLLSRVLAQSLHGVRQHQNPHNRYTRFYCQQSTTYRRTALSLQVIQYTELLLEMMGKRQSEKARWRVVVLLETVKAMCRLILMRLTNSRPLLSPPLPEREMPTEPAHQDEDHIPSPPSERSEASHAGSEQWTMPRTSLTLPPLPSSDDISSYLLSKVLTADDIKPPKALLHPVSGLGEVAEVIYILRPVIYAAAMAYWCQRRGGKGKADWRPWLIGISIEFAAQQLARRDLETRRPGGARGLTQLERDELKKRGWAMAWWAMRGAFYDNVTRGMITSVTSRLKGKPLLDVVAGFVDDYDFLWDNYFFPTATM